jgi:type I restriction-modification system DNA methylase subunit
MSSKEDINKFIGHLRNYEYKVDQQAKAELGEVFTPINSVNQQLENIELLDPKAFTDSKRTVIDICAGNGQFLSEVLVRRLQNGISLKEALKTIYGLDINESSVIECRERLLCGQEHLRPIVEQNIVCADALKYHYRFDGSDPYKTKQDLHIESLFLQ